MAVIEVAVQAVVPGGIDLVDTTGLSTSNTYHIPNDGRTALHFKKTGAGACTVTVQTPRTVGGLAVAEHTFTVPATTGDVMAGPFDPDTFNDADDKLNVTLSEVTGLSLAAYRIGN